MAQTPYMQHMRGMKQLEAEARRLPDPTLRLLATIANSAIEQRLASGLPSDMDVQMLTDAAKRAK